MDTRTSLSIPNAASMMSNASVENWPSEYHKQKRGENSLSKPHKLANEAKSSCSVIVRAVNYPPNRRSGYVALQSCLSEESSRTETTFTSYSRCNKTCTNTQTTAHRTHWLTLPLIQHTPYFFLW